MTGSSSKIPADFKTAKIEWKDGRTPVSRQFSDVYFSAEDGLAESRHVYVQGNALPEAWQGRDIFCIAETGFGTGLNFLATWDLWRRTRAPGARLHYVSVEGFPLDRADLALSLRSWTELRGLAEQLIDAYPDPHRGFHRLHLPDGVTLTLLMGEVGAMLGELEGVFDAWYLDGFAPAQNPDMWRMEVMGEIARLSKPGTSLATFTVAGAVRRALAEHGFRVEKAAGFGRKRDMCRAWFEGGTGTALPKPWFHMPSPFDKDKRATILGGGIAGASIAQALNRRGFEVCVLERHKALAQEASGNPVGIVMPRLTTHPLPEARVYTEAFRYAVQEFQKLDADGAKIDFRADGVLHLAHEENDTRRFSAMEMHGLLPESQMHLLSPREASGVAGVTIDRDTLCFPKGGSVNPAALCAALTKNCETRLGAEAADVFLKEGGWVLRDASGVTLSQNPLLILANGVGAGRMSELSWLPLQAFRGQISQVPSDAKSSALKSVLIFGTYIIPAQEGWHCIGATYDKMPSLSARPRQSVRKADHVKNLNGVQDGLPDFFTHVDMSAVRGRAALRCTTPDFQPVVGPVPDEAAYREIYDGVRLGQKGPFPPAQYHGGLFAHLALGSRGLTTALLSAELLASQICGEPWPVERSLAQTLHPGRFLMRQIKRAAR